MAWVCSVSCARSPRRHNISANSEFLVNNPIYIKSSTASLTGQLENGVQPLRSLNSNNTSTALTTASLEGKQNSSPTHGSLAEAQNPQYGVNSVPPLSDRYIKVNSGAEPIEPMYELVKGSSKSTDGDGQSADPVYSTPAPVPAKRNSSIPMYESTMDVAATVGLDGAYAKLNHNHSQM